MTRAWVRNQSISFCTSPTSGRILHGGWNKDDKIAITHAPSDHLLFRYFFHFLSYIKSSLCDFSFSLRIRRLFSMQPLYCSNLVPQVCLNTRTGKAICLYRFMHRQSRPSLIQIVFYFVTNWTACF